MRLLYAITSYNRYFLLKNTVESVFAFAPQGDVLIADDGSTDQALLQYYRQLEAEGRVVVLQKSHAGDAQKMHGGLYDCMNRATEYAIEKGYSHIFYLQDDVQFMWKDSDLLHRIEHVFATHADAAMVNPIFQKKIIARSMRDRLEPYGDADAWHLKPYGIADIGCVRVELLKEKQWRFGATETKNHVQWSTWGYKLYCLRCPVLAWVPWPPVYNRERRQGVERKPRRAFLLKPLSERQVKTLRSLPLQKIPYTEDFCFPWGWWCWSPYCFTILNMEYWNNLRKAVKRGECFPHPVIRW
jgi:glycosyltransferase involved in cell wall biosynthesis